MPKQKYKTNFQDIWPEYLSFKGRFLKIQQTIIWPTIKYAPKIFKVLPTALSLLLGTLRDLNIKKRTLREVNQP